MNSKKLQDVFEYTNVEAIISESPQTRLWYSGISTSDGWLIIEPNEATLFVDGRYYEYATKNAKRVNVRLLEGDSLKFWLLNRGFEKIGLEEDYLTLATKNKIKKWLDFTNEDHFVNIDAKKLRIIKDSEEVTKIQRAIDISLEAFDKLKPFIAEGISEKELQDKLEYIMTRKGANKEAFDSIVAFGENTAEPHHHSSYRTLKNGDIVTIDFGAMFDGYCADITRTFIYNPTPSPQNDKWNEILQIVEEAARLGREAVKPGIRTSDIDSVCRSYIASKGYSKFFVHSTGHGLGIDVHELPNVSQMSDYVLEEGMVITIEPGIYIEGIGGARIEDDVLVTKDGSRVLSRK